MDAEVGHTGAVGGQQRKEIAGECQFVRPLSQMLADLVQRVVPKVLQELLGGGVVTGEVDAVDHILALDFHDAPGEGVEPPGDERLVIDLLTVIVVAVAVNAVPIDPLRDVALRHGRCTECAPLLAPNVRLLQQSRKP